MKVIGILLLLIPVLAFAQYANVSDPAYDKTLSAKVLERSVFYLPREGAVYRAKFEELLMNDDRIRGVIIHNHGCAGQHGWETYVAQFYYRLGFAVITPDFLTRPGNRAGCPGNTDDWMTNSQSTLQFKIGTFSARNMARLDARVDDTEALVKYVESFTKKPIILSGHSEGARTTYHWDRQDAHPQVIGAILHNQSCSEPYAHIWKLSTKLPTWQVLERQDPASHDAANGLCGWRYKGEDAKNYTGLHQDGTNHDPLQNREAQESLTRWLNQLMGGTWQFKDPHNEKFIKGISERIYGK